MTVRPPDPSTREGSSLIARAFDVLRAFNATERVMTLSEITRATDLPKSTVHRLLARLLEAEAVEREGGGYKLGVHIMQLGAITPASLMRDLAVPHMARLHHWCGQSVSLGLLRELQVVYVEQVADLDHDHYLTPVGTRRPATETAMGTVLLAWEDIGSLSDRLPEPTSAANLVQQLMHQLRDARSQNFVRVCHEATGGTSLAAAIVINGTAVGAIDITIPATTPEPPGAPAALRESVARLAQELHTELQRAGVSRMFPGTGQRPLEIRPPRSTGRV